LGVTKESISQKPADFSVQERAPVEGGCTKTIQGAYDGWGQLLLYLNKKPSCR